MTELALIRSCSEIEAESLAGRVADPLTTKLTGTWSALYDGRIDVRKMRALVDLLGPATPEGRRRDRGPGPARAPSELTVAQLRQRVRRALARLDAKALEKRRARGGHAGPTSATSRPATG